MGVFVNVGEGVAVKVAVNVEVLVGVGVLSWSTDVILQDNTNRLTPRKPRSSPSPVFFPAMCAFIANTSIFMLCAQRGALPAGGREDGTLLCRNQPPASELPENAATPTRRVHAVLGGFLF